ncbi:MAG: MAPEG family protein [Kofleriaceae bacterium]
MNAPTALSLTGFIAWTLALLIVMAAIRAQLVLTRQVPANGFTPDNANLSPFMQRLARAYLNCLEGLPIYGGLMAIALITGHTEITDPLAIALLGARIIQSTIHLISTSTAAVTARFAAFLTQLAIGTCWAYRLLRALDS